MKIEILTYVTILVFLALCEFSSVKGVELEIDLRLTPEQKKIMDKFKALVSPKLPDRYMREEIYLIRWLRAKNFNLKEAEKFLLQNLKWRKENRMQTIHKEDWSDMEVEMPYDITAVDKRGQPVICAISKFWDLRALVVTGRYRRAIRYLDKAMDEATNLVRKWQLEGKNVTQFELILQMQSFNLHQHGCPRCLTGILEFIDSYENHFPGMADKILLVGTPPVYEAIANVVRDALGPATKAAFKVYGSDEKVWKTKLLELIDADQLTEEFGGTKPSRI